MKAKKPLGRVAFSLLLSTQQQTKQKYFGGILFVRYSNRKVAGMQNFC